MEHIYCERLGDMDDETLQAQVWSDEDEIFKHPSLPAMTFSRQFGSCYENFHNYYTCKDKDSEVCIAHYKKFVTCAANVSNETPTRIAPKLEAAQEVIVNEVEKYRESDYRTLKGYGKGQEMDDIAEHYNGCAKDVFCRESWQSLKSCTFANVGNIQSCLQEKLAYKSCAQDMALIPVRAEMKRLMGPIQKDKIPHLTPPSQVKVDPGYRVTCKENKAQIEDQHKN